MGREKTTQFMSGTGVVRGILAFVVVSLVGCGRDSGPPEESVSIGSSSEERIVLPVEQRAAAYTREGFLAAVEGTLNLESQVERYGQFARIALDLPPEAYAEAMDALMARGVPFRHLDFPIYLLLRWMEIDAEGGAGWMASQPMTESFSIVVENVFFNWGLNQPVRALAIAERTGDAGFRLLAVASALRAMERRDAERAREETRRLEDMLQEAPRMDSIALLTRLDPDAAWDELNRAWIGGEHNPRAWRSFFEVLAGSDPQRAVGLLSRLPDDSLQTGMGMAVFGIWAKTDPQSALAEAMRFPDLHQSHAVIMEVIESASEVDPIQGLALARTVVEPNQRRQAILRAVQMLDPHQPGGSLASIGQLESPSARQMAYDQFLPRMAAVDPEGTIDWMQANLDGGSLARAMVSVASAQAQRDPVQAAGWVDQLPPGQFRSRALQQVARIWADKDPLEAFAWARSLPNSGDRQRAVSSLAPALARSDIDQAIVLASELPTGEARAVLEQQVALQLAVDDPLTAMEWAQGIAAGDSRNRAASSVLYQWARKDPESAFLFAVSEQDARVRNDHLSRVASTWASQDPEAAVETLAAFSDRGLEPYLFNGALSQWINSDEEDASRWLMTKASDGVRDQGLSMLVQERLQHNAPAALADAMQIGGEEQRRQALRQILAWSQYFDPAFGRAVLNDDSTLSPADRVALQDEFADQLSGDG